MDISYFFIKKLIKKYNKCKLYQYNSIYMNVNLHTSGSTNAHDVHLPRCAVTGKTHDLYRVKIVEGIENPYNYIMLSKDIYTQFGKKFVVHPQYGSTKHQDPRNSQNTLVVCNIQYDQVFKAHVTCKNSVFVPLGSIGFILLRYLMGIPNVTREQLSLLYEMMSGCTIVNNYPYEPDGCAIMLPFDYIP